MFDYLGTFTPSQLIERHTWLTNQIHALESSLLSLRSEANNLLSLLTEDTGAPGRNFPIIHKQGDKAYHLADVSVPLARSESYYSSIGLSASLSAESGYPVRLDRVTGDISLGDSAWRSSPKLATVEEKSTTLGGVQDDDADLSAQYAKIMQPFMGLLKRPESLEEKNKKAKYLYLRLQDSILEKENIIQSLFSEVSIITPYLSPLYLPNAANDSLYISNNILENKVDPSTVTENIYEYILPSLDLDTVGPSSTDSVIPQGPYTYGNAILSEFVKDFPHCNPPDGTGSSLTKSQSGQSVAMTEDQMQWLSNIWFYGKNSLALIPESDYLFRKGVHTGRYAAKNVIDPLISWSKWIYETYGLSLRVTEAWPPNQRHKATGHFIGTSLDVTFAYGREVLSYGGGYLTQDLLKAVLTKALNEHWIISYSNEYSGKGFIYTKGAHLHVDFEKIYFTDGALKHIKPL